MNPASPGPLRRRPRPVAAVLTALLLLGGLADWGLRRVPTTPSGTSAGLRAVAPVVLPEARPGVAPVPASGTEARRPPPPALPPSRPLSREEEEIFVRFANGLAGHRGRPHGEGTDAEDSWEATAKARLAIMTRLIREDPRQALAHALSWDAWAALPAEWRPWVEEPFSDRQDTEVIAGCGPDGSPRREPERWLREPSGVRVSASVHGRRAAFGSKRNQPVNGIRVAGHAAVRESVLQRLSPAEFAAVRDRFPSGNPRPDRSLVRGEPLLEPIHALGGGHVYSFADESEFAALEERLLELEALPGPESAAARLSDPEVCGVDGTLDPGLLTRLALHGANQWTRTPKKVFIIRVDLPDVPGAPATRETIRGQLNGPIAQWFRTQSRGLTWIEAEASREVFRLSRKGTDPFTADEFQKLRDDARALARRAYALEGYHIIGVSFPDLGFGWTGRATVGGDALWLQGPWIDSVSAHELGHNYGLYHASGWRTLDGSVNGPGEFVEYGNPLDVMGAAPFPEGFFQPASLRRLNWVTSDDTPGIPTSGRYRLPAHDRFRTGPVGFQFVVDGEQHWIGFRAHARQQGALHEGLEFNQVLPDEPRTRMLDFTPATEEFRDALWPVSEAFLDPRGRFCVTPLAQGGTDPDEWIEFAVEFDRLGLNRAPSVTVEWPGPPAVREPMNFRITATDPDGDVLQRYWSLDDGPWRPVGETFSHPFAMGGVHRIRARAIDLKGGRRDAETTVSLPDPLLEWTTAWTNGLTAIGVGTDRLIAAQGNTCWSSLNLDDWSRVAVLDTNQRITAFLAAGSRWVGVGRDYDFGRGTTFGSIITSEDGVDWRNASVPPTPGLTAVAFGPGVWIAVGGDSTVLRSADGRNWSSVPFPARARPLNALAFGLGQFVIVDTALVARSSDGLVWNTNPPPRSFLPRGVAFLEGGFGRPARFHAHGRGPATGGLLWSTNGVTWHAPVLPEAARGATVLALCRTPDGALLGFTESPAGHLASLDGDRWEWNPVAIVPIRNPRSFRGRLVGHGDDSQFRRSGLRAEPNRPPTLALPAAATAVARTPFPTQARIADPDGDSVQAYWDLGDGRWTAGTSTRTDWWPVGGRTTRQLMVIDPSGASARITNTVEVAGPLTVWTPADSSAPTEVLDFLPGPGNRVVAVTSRALHTSTDAVQWAATPSLGPTVLLAAGAADDEGWVVVGSEYDFTLRRWFGFPWHSVDGRNWTRSAESAPSELLDVACGAGLWVAVGRNGAALRSENGRQWRSVTMPRTVLTMEQIVRCQDTFVVAGTHHLWFSSDGWSWVSRPGPLQGRVPRIFTSGPWLLARLDDGYWLTGDLGLTWRPLGHSRLPVDAAFLPHVRGLHLAFGTGAGGLPGVAYSADAHHWRWMDLPGMPKPTLVVPWGDTGRFLLAAAGGRLHLSDVLPPEPVDWPGWQGFHLAASTAAEETGDPDGDGRDNLVEYAFGSNPNAAEVFRPPRLQFEAGHAVVTVDKPPGREWLRYEASVPAALNPGLTEAERVLTVLEDGPQRLRVRLPAPAASHRAAFIAISPRR